MATVVLTDGVVTIGGTAYSDHVKSCALNYSAEQLDDTAFGDSTRSMKGGLKVWDAEVVFHADEAASEPNADLFSVVGTTTTLEIKPTSSATSATNPKYTGTVLLTGINPIGGAVGDLQELRAAFVAAGDLSRATS